MRNIEAELMAKQLMQSMEKNGIKVTNKIKEEVIQFANEYSSRRFDYIQKTLAVLTILVKNNKGAIPDYVWNRIADENGFFNNISIEYLLGQNWRDIRKVIK